MRPESRPHASAASMFVGKPPWNDGRVLDTATTEMIADAQSVPTSIHAARRLLPGAICTPTNTAASPPRGSIPGATAKRTCFPIVRTRYAAARTAIQRSTSHVVGRMSSSIDVVRSNVEYVKLPNGRLPHAEILKSHAFPPRNIAPTPAPRPITIARLVPYMPTSSSLSPPNSRFPRSTKSTSGKSTNPSDAATKKSANPR